MITAHFPPFEGPVDKLWDSRLDSCRYDEPLLYKPAIPEVDERKKSHIEWKKINPQAVHNWWMDGHFADGRTVREVLEEAKMDRTEQVGGTHYAEMEIQPWTALYAWMTPSEVLGYHVGTVIGYLARHKKKGGLQDLKKAKHHMEELIRYFENDEEYPG